MASWHVEAQDCDEGQMLIERVLLSVRVWQWMTKPQRAALLAAVDGLVTAHPATVDALERHGLAVGDAHVANTGRLTRAGEIVRYWNAPRPRASGLIAEAMEGN